MLVPQSLGLELELFSHFQHGPTPRSVGKMP